MSLPLCILTLLNLSSECRSLVPTADIKRKITKSILQMSLDHHIVTPLTAMVIENDAGDERMLADSPQQDYSCCSGQCFKTSWGNRTEWPSCLVLKSQSLCSHL